MPSPETSTAVANEVPEGAIFLPFSRDRALKNIESQMFQLYVGGRGPLGDLSLEEKVEKHAELSAEKAVLLGAVALDECY